jgi:ATP-dependent Lon protease
MVLPIGGLKEKALAAQRAGINRLVIPRRNERDIDDIPEPLRKKMRFTLVDSVDEVLAAALRKHPVRSTASQARRVR